MPKQRNYKAEYRRRLARGKAKGLSRAQARGHPKAGERLLSGMRPTAPVSDAKIEAAIRLMHDGKALSTSARAAHMSVERLGRIIKQNNIARLKGRTWQMSDNRPRRVPVIVGSNVKAVTVPSFDEASKAGGYHNAVHRFVMSGDLSHMEPFVGQELTDVKGRSHPFETDPNALLRYAAKDEPPFHEIYQIISN